MKLFPKKNASEDRLGDRLTSMILKYLTHVPETRQTTALTPAQTAREIANAAAMKAAAASAACALPPGPLGWLTLLPELATVWKIQSQMVADIAGVYGKSTELSREQMIYCIFRHGAALAMRDIVIRVGDRFIVREATPKILEKVAKKIGIKLTQKTVGKAVSRWIPIIGAAGVGAYAFYDTSQVAKTAIELFESEIKVEPIIPPPLPERLG